MWTRIAKNQSLWFGWTEVNVAEIWMRAMRTGVGLGLTGCRGLRDALGPAFSMWTVPPALHWSQLALETGSHSQLQLLLHSHTQACPHIRPRAHAQAGRTQQIIALVKVKTNKEACRFSFCAPCFVFYSWSASLSPSAVLSLYDIHPGEE